MAGGSGGTTLFGGAGGTTQYTAAAGALFYAAGSGNETLDASGSSTNNQLFAARDTAGHDVLIGGSGNDTIVAGSGGDTLAGGATSHDLFVFLSANGGIAAKDIVINFNAGDTVLLAGYATSEVTHALDSATVSAGSTTITLSDNTQITFSGVASAASLTGHIGASG